MALAPPSCASRKAAAESAPLSTTREIAVFSGALIRKWGRNTPDCVDCGGLWSKVEQVRG